MEATHRNADAHTGAMVVPFSGLLIQSFSIPVKFTSSPSARRSQLICQWSAPVGKLLAGALAAWPPEKGREAFDRRCVPTSSKGCLLCTACHTTRTAINALRAPDGVLGGVARTREH